MSVPVRKVFLHCGVEKTGSTLIQKALSRMGRLSHDHKLSVIPREAVQQMRFFRYMERFRQENWQPDKAELKAAREEWKGMKLRGDAALLTHEFMLGSARRSFYRNAEHCAETLASVFAGSAIRFIIYVKRQDRHYESLYKQLLQSGLEMDKETFLRRVNYKEMNWVEVLDRIADKVGQERMVVLPAEKIGEGPDRFIQHFLTVCGVDYRDPIPIPEDSNRSYNAKGIEIANRCNRFLDESERKLLRKFLMRYFTGSLGPQSHIFPAETRLRIAQKHRRDNGVLFKKYLKKWSAYHYNNWDSLFDEVEQSRSG